MKLEGIKVSLRLPYIGDVEGTWKPDQNERLASWEMYVELVTRTSIAELGPTEGLLREALSSYHALFDITRKILRQYGPGIAQPKGNDHLSFGYLAVAILNSVLRPVLTKWHPLLLDYENQKPASVSSVEWEQQWDKSAELRKAFQSTHSTLVAYADLLSQVAEVPSLIIEKP